MIADLAAAALEVAEEIADLSPMATLGTKHLLDRKHQVIHMDDSP